MSILPPECGQGDRLMQVVPGGEKYMDKYNVKSVEVIVGQAKHQDENTKECSGNGRMGASFKNSQFKCIN